MRLPWLPLVLASALAACGEVKPSIVDGPQPIDAAVDAPDSGMPMVTLTVARSGMGTVTSSPAGITCGATCTGQFAPGTQVTLTAAPDASSAFTSWGGACSGTVPTCTLTLTADTTASATFDARMFRVTANLVGNGQGTVVATPASIGLTCPGACTAMVPYDTQLTLTATPTGSSLFAGWSGGPCAGSAPCTWNVTADTTVNAAFALNYTLIVTRTGTGTGSVTSSPAGISCGADCDETYTASALVTLTATADASSTFTGWSGGGCSGTGPCVVTMDAAKAVAADFTLRQHTLTVTTGGTGTGAVSSNPIGIACGADCSESFAHGTMVALTATAGTSSAFTGWTGACSGVGPCIVTMDMARAVGATFTLDQLSLTVSKAGTGAGLVTSSPAGITCGATCTASFAAGTVIALSATPQPSSTFTGWSGGGCAGTGACMVTLAASTTVTATFALNRYTLTVARSGTGASFGTVTSSPAGITCGTDCSEAYDHGTMVTLTAAGGAGATFDGWPATSGCTGTGPCVVTVTAATTINAPFTLAQYTLTAAVAGGGTGTITSSPAGINCPGTCARPFAYNTMVTLTATPAANHTFAGWSGGCTGTGTCVVTITGAINVTATMNPPPNVAFVTSSVHTGNLGGLAGADAICQARASAVGLTGTYRAWLSTTTVNAIDRLGTASGWVRPDGRPFVNSRADLVAGRIFYPLILNERNASEAGDTVWTATQANGLGNPNSCANWTSTTDAGQPTIGFDDQGTTGWTQNGGAACTSSNHLYCFGVDFAATVAPPTPTAVRRAFVSAGNFLPNAGLAAADALCNSEASAAGLPGTYRALLATDNATAASRFSTAGNPWARVDNVVLAPTGAGFLAPGTATHWAAPLNVTAAGGYTTSRIWAGAPSLSTVGAGTDCLNWTSAAPTPFAAVGISQSSAIATAFANYTTAGAITACTNTQHKVMCLQQ